MLTTQSFFDLSDFDHQPLFSNGYVWETLTQLKDYMNGVSYPELTGLPNNRPLPESLILHEGNLLNCNDMDIDFGDATKGGLTVSMNGQQLVGASVLMAGSIFCGNHFAIGTGVLIEAGALIKSPAIIGDCTEVRQGAYLRGYCITGKRCVVGHTTEVKHSIFLNDAKAGHFAYLGDSILGNDANLGAGTKMANLRFTGGDVPIRTPQGIIQSGLRKFGAILGDKAQTGCNSVTNPGALLGKKSMLMPNTTSPSGYHPPNSLIR